MNSDATPAPAEPRPSAGSEISPLRRRLSGRIARLAARSASRPMRLRELAEALHTRGGHPLLLLLAFPFLLPVPLPGLSTLFGLVIALLGIRTALAREPWLPDRLAERAIPSGLLARPLLATSRAVRRLERLLRPRLLYPDHPVLFRRAGGALTTICGLLMLLPLPVPLSNSLPAATVILLAAAGLGRDGAFFLAGCLNFLLCLAFFGLLAFGGVEAWQRLLG